jgi:chitinase
MTRSRRIDASPWRIALAAMLLGAMSIGNAWATNASPTHCRVIGYATGWNPAQDKSLHEIDTLIFAFAKVEAGRVVLTDKAAGRLAPVIALKARDPKLQVEISVGGWAAG